MSQGSAVCPQPARSWGSGEPDRLDSSPRSHLRAPVPDQPRLGPGGKPKAPFNNLSDAASPPGHSPAGSRVLHPAEPRVPYPVPRTFPCSLSRVPQAPVFRNPQGPMSHIPCPLSRRVPCPADSTSLPSPPLVPGRDRTSPHPPPCPARSSAWPRGRLSPGPARERGAPAGAEPPPETGAPPVAPRIPRRCGRSVRALGTPGSRSPGPLGSAGGCGAAPAGPTGGFGGGACARPVRRR